MGGTTVPTTLIYKATRDGFSASSFHAKCDGKARTYTIIKSNSNSVFGGFTAVKWASSGDYSFTVDGYAFFFSLRRSGVSNNEKFLIKPGYSAIFNQFNYGPTFGNGHDMHVCDNSNIYTGSYTYFGISYTLPSGYSVGAQNTMSYLAGSFDKWLTTEIEVFQII
jgi:hypothetical protein